MPEAGTPAERVRRSLRHPVYVHSKLMVVDDEYGGWEPTGLQHLAPPSGRRVGQHQPAVPRWQQGQRDLPRGLPARPRNHLPPPRSPCAGRRPRGSEELPRGGVGGPPRGVEGGVGLPRLPPLPAGAPLLLEPLLQAVREVTRGQWARYTREKAQASPGHLLPYPVTVADSGQVDTSSSRSACRCPPWRPPGTSSPTPPPPCSAPRAGSSPPS